MIDRARIKVVCFEDFIKSPKEKVSELCRFLGIDPLLMPKHAFNIHTHKAKIPKYQNLQARKNYLFRNWGSNFYKSSLPFQQPNEKEQISAIQKLIIKLHIMINPHLEIKKPTIDEETRKFLDQYFYHELKGIDELTGEKLLENWFPEKEY